MMKHNAPQRGNEIEIEEAGEDGEVPVNSIFEDEAMHFDSPQHSSEDDSDEDMQIDPPQHSSEDDSDEDMQVDPPQHFSVTIDSLKAFAKVLYTNTFSGPMLLKD